MVPHGYRFNPTDEELIQVLDRKVSGQEMPLHFIVETNVYEHEPPDLEWNHTRDVSNDERYYYCRREINDSREVIGRGWWKATSHVKKIYADEVVGFKRPLTFHRYKDKDRNRNNAIKTNWIMHEYSLESRTAEWRLCKIKYKGKPSIHEEMENLKQNYSSKTDLEAGSSVSFQLDSVSEQQQVHPVLPSLPFDDGYDQQPYCQWNDMQQLPQPSYDPYLPSLSSIAGYHFVGQQDHVEPTDQEPFTSLWSWQN